jgi:hypothetical protein
MSQVFWIGVYPGIGTAALEYMVETLRLACGVGRPACSSAEHAFPSKGQARRPSPPENT